MLGERHPDTAGSLGNLALLLESQGDYAAAKPLLEQAVDISRHNLDLAADTQTERQQLAMADMLRSLSMSSSRPALRAGIGHRGELSPGPGLEGGHPGTPAAAPRPPPGLLPRRPPARGRPRRGRVAVHCRPAGHLGPGPARPQPAGRLGPDSSSTLTERKDQLEEELTRQTAAFRHTRAEARRTPEQLQAALPRDAALIDVLEYTHSSPPPEHKGKLKFDARRSRTWSGPIGRSRGWS